LAPAALLLAPDPARAAEAVAWAFLAGWLLRVDRPLAPAGMPRAIALPAGLYLACVVSSWLALTIADAGGIDSAALPRFLLTAIGIDHLWATSPEPETSGMLLAAAGMGVLFASLALTRAHDRLAARLATSLVVSATALAGAAAISVLRLWAGADYALWWLARYPTIERVALHMPDVNAAGSVYAMALFAAAGAAIGDGRRRWLWTGLAALIAVGLVLAGSRTAMLVSVAVAGGMFAVTRGGWRPRPYQVAAGLAGLVLLVTVGVFLARGGDEQNAASRALRQRAEFMETTARMLATSPALGVGVGRYHSRSGEFMPSDLRAIYGYENAHNYFAQQFAELGLIGGVLFGWLVLAALRSAWSAAARGWAHAGLAGGVTAYAATCLAGHPLLVAEAALPFWPLLGAAASGAVAASAPGRTPHLSTPRATRLAVAAAVLLVAVPAGLAGVQYRGNRGTDRGFYELERDDEGIAFRRTTRHAVTFIDAQPGFLTLTVRADEAGLRPFELVTEIDGREVDRRTVPSDRWETITLPVRPRPESDATTQRVDLRVSHTYARREGPGVRDTLPTGIKVRIRWEAYR
jgi:hypothetical protein